MPHSPQVPWRAQGTEQHIVPRAWTELFADLRSAPPLFFIDAAAAGLYGFEGHAIGRYPQLAHFVAHQYRPVALIDGVPIFRRREAPRDPSDAPSSSRLSRAANRPHP